VPAGSWIHSDGPPFGRPPLPVGYHLVEQAGDQFEVASQQRAVIGPHALDLPPHVSLPEPHPTDPRPTDGLERLTALAEPTSICHEHRNESTPVRDRPPTDDADRYQTAR